MLLLHFSDLHLGVETYGHVDAATGLNSRLLDSLAALDSLVELALGVDSTSPDSMRDAARSRHSPRADSAGSPRADVVLFCGDAYKSRDPSQTQQRELARRISKLAASGIQVFLLAGNHDLPASPSRANTVEIFSILSSSKGTLTLPNVTVASKPGVHVLQARSGPLQVVALPWVQRRALLAKEEHKNLTLAEMDQKARDMVVGWLQEAYRGLDESIPAVLCSHISVESAKVGSERSMMLGHDLQFLKSSLLDPRLDYVALGHIHKHQALNLDPPVVYSGALQAVDFGEEGEPKGFCLVEIDPSKPAGRRAEWKFCPVASRPFLTIEAKALPPNPTEAVLKAIARNQVEGAIVRLRIEVAEEDRRLVDEGAIRKALATSHAVAAISWEVAGATRATRLEASAGLSPTDALRRYLESRGTSPERARTLQEYGERLIREVEP